MNWWIRLACWWTALATGLRHGRRGFPAAGHTTQVRSGTAPGYGLASARLSYLEAEHLAIREARITRLVQKWLGVKHRLDGQLSMVRCEMAQLLAELGTLHDQHRALGYREPWGVVSLRTYTAWVLGASLAELAFNALAFERRDLTIEKAYAFAAGIAIACQLAAHIVGCYLRQNRPDALHRRTLGITWLASAVLAIGLGSVTILRATHLGTTDGIQLLALAGMNACFLMAATLGAFASHDAADVHRICAQKKRVKARLDRPWRRWVRLASEWDGARARYMQEAVHGMWEAIAVILELRRGVALSTPGGAVPSHFGDPVDERLFRPRPEFGQELQGTPPPLADLIAAVTDPKAAPQASPTALLPLPRVSRARANGANHQPGHSVTTEGL